MTYYDDMVRGRLKKYTKDVNKKLSLYEVDGEVYNLSEKEV